MTTQAQPTSGNGHAAAAQPVSGMDFWERADEVRESIREVYAPRSTDAQFLVFWNECKRRRAIPGKHIHFRLQKNKEREWDDTLRQWSEKWTEKPIFITSIDFFRLTAHRTGKYAGQKPLAWYYLDKDGEPTIRKERVPHPTMIPYAAEATVLRSDFQEPLVRTARYNAFVQTYKDKSGDTYPNQMWQKMGPEQLAKCAEAQALRAAFPEELGGLYVTEEIQPDDQEPAVIQREAASAPALPPPQTPAVPVIDHPKQEEQATAPAAVPPAVPEIEGPPKLQVSSVVHPTSVGVAVSEGAAAAPAEKPKGVSVEDVQKRFSGTLTEGDPKKPPLARPAEAKGAEGFKWYLRNVLDPAGVKEAGKKLQTFVLKAAGAKTIKDVSDAQKAALLELLDKRLAKDGPTAVAALVEEKAAA